MTPPEIWEEVHLHWLEILETQDSSLLGGTGCALCQTYEECVGCPVADYANDKCHGTPYYPVTWSFMGGDIPEERAIFIQAEIEFLHEVEQWEKEQHKELLEGFHNYAETIDWGDKT